MARPGRDSGAKMGQPAAWSLGQAPPVWGSGKEGCRGGSKRTEAPFCGEEEQIHFWGFGQTEPAHSKAWLGPQDQWPGQPAPGANGLWQSGVPFSAEPLG